jgi:hypothetical protein
MSNQNTSKVAAMPGIRSEDFKPDEECIEFLEMLLARAKAGDIVGFAAVTFGPQNTIGTLWKGNTSVMVTAAGIGLLHQRYFSSWNEMTQK